MTIFTYPWKMKQKKTKQIIWNNIILFFAPNHKFKHYQELIFLESLNQNSSGFVNVRLAKLNTCKANARKQLTHQKHVKCILNFERLRSDQTNEQFSLVWFFLHCNLICSKIWYYSSKWLVLYTIVERLLLLFVTTTINTCLA